MTTETPAPTEEQAQPAPKRALVLVAHPDDAEFLCGGAVAKLCAQGWEVTYALATSGDKGTKDPEMTPAKLAAVREQEQRDACVVLGVKEVRFLGYPDGFVPDNDEFRGVCVRLIRELKPDLVITWDGFRKTFNHTDHRVVGICTYDAVYPASRDPLYYPEQIAEGLDWHRVNEIWLAGADEPDWFVDISDHWQTKIEALLCHTSQVARDMERDAWVTMMTERAKEGAERNGIAFAEAFRRVVLR